jgi:sigma-B regulation protein RsbU (phosphoserine phosphatase)
VAVIGEGGFVVGLLPEVKYEAIRLRLHPGERLWLYTDGIVDCRNRQDELFAQERLVELAADTHQLPLNAALQTLERRLRRWSEELTFEDDVSVLVIEHGAALTEQGQPPGTG